MHKLFNEIINSFYKENKIKLYFLFFLSIIAGIFEYIGLLLIFQFAMFLTNPSANYCIKITTFFNKNLNIYNYSKIGLLLGLLITFIYIFKNIYMLIYTKINNAFLEDLSVKITLKTIKNILFSPYLTIKKISNAQKLSILNKITLVVWQFCYKYINFFTNLIIISIILIYLFIKFTKVAVIATVFVTLLSILEYCYLKYRSNYQNKNYTKILDKINNTLVIIFNSIKEIKLNNKENYFLSKSKQEYSQLATLNKDRNFNTIIHIYFTEISVMFCFIVILITLFYTTNFNNQLLISSLCTICVIVLRLTPLINRAQSSLYAINSNKQAVCELLEFEKLFKTIKDENHTNEKLKFSENIEIKNGKFYYDDKNYLKNINLKIKKNDFITMIGKSGQGKTTLSLIFSGLIKLNQGEILIDNKELKEFKKWQNNIALLSQDFTFLSEKIGELLDFQNQKTIDLLNQLELKNIENKKINELSTGEKQRLALIELLLKDKEILILDEITSNVDVKSQNKIAEIIDKLKGSKTIFNITHNLDLIKDEDIVIYIKDNETILIDLYQNIKNCFK